jgi:hypothetical protein
MWKETVMPFMAFFQSLPDENNRSYLSVTTDSNPRALNTLQE